MHTIAMFGGSFNPIHHGHLRCALEVADALGLDEIRMIPCGNPPHREKPKVSAEHRFQMLKLACKDTPKLIPDPQEIMRDEISYSLTTIESLTKLYPNSKLFLMVGMDSVNQLPTWYKWQTLLSSVVVIAISRAGHTNSILPALAKHIQPIESFNKISDADYGTIIPLEVTRLDISSTHIREVIKKGVSARFLTPTSVLDYIQANGLYN